jgi:hypothetical protein
MRLILISYMNIFNSITYYDVVSNIKTIALPRGSPAFGDLLGEISTEEEAVGLGMLTAIVVQGQGDTAGC